jgi:hypothetical protein
MTGSVAGAATDTALGTRAGGWAGAGWAAVAGTALQFTVTRVDPVAAPDVTVTIAVPPCASGAVRVTTTPLPWSTAVVGEKVPRLVAKFKVAPATFAFALTSDELPQF